MNRRCLASVVVLAAFAASCTENAGEPTGLETVPSLAASGPVAHGAGGGGYILPLGGVDLPGTFAFGALQFADGAVQGRLRFTLEVSGVADLGLADGLVDIHGEVTCVTDDPANDRLWVGGVVTRNASTQPDFRDDPTTQVGGDVWFRAVDYGQGAGADQPDRVTFVGFEGSAGIITSEEYCETQPWPDDDARTNEVVSGNIQVH